MVPQVKSARDEFHTIQHRIDYILNIHKLRNAFFPACVFVSDSFLRAHAVHGSFVQKHHESGTVCTSILILGSPKG